MILGFIFLLNSSNYLINAQIRSEYIVSSRKKNKLLTGIA